MSFSPALRRVLFAIAFTGCLLSFRLEAAQLKLLFEPNALRATNTFTNGVCTLERAFDITGPWQPVKNFFTSDIFADFAAPVPGLDGFYRAVAGSLTPDTAGFFNLINSYSLLTTVAGAGGDPRAVNKWQTSFEGGTATAALLSRPHIAMADLAGNIFIADKDAQAVRKVLLDGTIVTVAGINSPGSGTDQPALGTNVALNDPNGLWVRADGTVYILDANNAKVRRLDTNGILRTLFSIPGGVGAGRGLWVSDDESSAYVAAGTVVKKWTAEGGVVNFATGFIELGNLVMDPLGRLVVTDRGGHYVYRIGTDGTKTIIAGNGATFGGGDGEGAVETGLNEVRGVWFLPHGGYFLATHRGSQVWYVDTGGVIHLFLHGFTSNTHGGDGTWFYAPNEPRVSEIRAITMDHQGNILITEHDSGYVRKVEFLRHVAAD